CPCRGNGAPRTGGTREAPRPPGRVKPSPVRPSATVKQAFRDGAVRSERDPLAHEPTPGCQGPPGPRDRTPAWRLPRPGAEAPRRGPVLRALARQVVRGLPRSE